MTQPYKEHNLNKPVDDEPSQATSFGKSLRSRANRRSLSGAPLTFLFETKFQHLRNFQKTQGNSKGLNFLLAPPSCALYRSSLPVTPISTPIASQSLNFTEQSLRNRILTRSRSPRRGLWSPNDQPDIVEDTNESQSIAPSIPSSNRETSDLLEQPTQEESPPYHPQSQDEGPRAGSRSSTRKKHATKGAQKTGT